MKLQSYECLPNQEVTPKGTSIAEGMPVSSLSSLTAASAADSPASMSPAGSCTDPSSSQTDCNLARHSHQIECQQTNALYDLETSRVQHGQGRQYAKDARSSPGTGHSLFPYLNDCIPLGWSKL